VIPLRPGDGHTPVELNPKLIEVSRPADASGAVIVLHGGASRRENMMVSPTQLSVLRMVPIARRIARAGRGEVAVFRLLNSRRGWDAHHTPVRDVEWALGEVARLTAGLPVCLVGHSLGGRAALMAAGRPGVLGAVALAPWVLPTDDPPGLDAQRLLIVHGDRDRIASPARSAALADRLRRRGHPVEYVTVPGGKHAMLSHHRRFTEPAARFATQTVRAAVMA
jgi:predicted esterase